MARIQREMDEEEAGIVKTSWGEHLVAIQIRANDRGDIEAVQIAEKRIQKAQTTRRAARARNKRRKAELRN